MSDPPGVRARTSLRIDRRRRCDHGYLIMMRDSLYYFVALLCVAVVLGWLIFLTLGA
jgi:hypothetical protein